MPLKSPHAKEPPKRGGQPPPPVLKSVDSLAPVSRDSPASTRRPPSREMEREPRPRSVDGGPGVPGGYRTSEPVARNSPRDALSRESSRQREVYDPPPPVQQQQQQQLSRQLSQERLRSRNDDFPMEDLPKPPGMDEDRTTLRSRRPPPQPRREEISPQQPTYASQRPPPQLSHHVKDLSPPPPIPSSLSQTRSVIRWSFRPILIFMF